MLAPRFLAGKIKQKYHSHGRPLVTPAMAEEARC
jgi:hypothetical protein